MYEWLTGRCLCCDASEICSITQNAWPAYTLSFHMNYTEQTSVTVIITNSIIVYLINDAAERKSK